MLIETNSEKETWDLGFSLGEKACAGQVYTLVGDLGVGKTIFTKGLAKGLGIDEPVSSPTFTIVQIYDEGRIPFYHFDVYRWLEQHGGRRGTLPYCTGSKRCCGSRGDAGRDSEGKRRYG